MLKENIPAFKQWLREEKGIEATSPFDKLQELRERAAQAQTPAEKNKYLTQAKKLFETIHPEVKKQNICLACIKKVGGKAE